ncbi:MAG: polysaccharide deacetylase family protein [Oscillospiraceae bacterium]|jgi:peptidoglycan/xylan/chitin deacetylase (PgdA/CDA1 family)|nr:polysaccharide deacetylase family protein [Oscillospiraceae bacterium]
MKIKIKKEPRKDSRSWQNIFNKILSAVSLKNGVKNATLLAFAGLLIICALMFVIGLSKYKTNEKPKDNTVNAGFTVAEPVYEYGEPETLVDNGTALHSYIIYPKTGMPDIDKVIYEWAYGKYNTTLSEASAKGQGIEAELNAQYNSYLVKNDYAGIEEIGFYGDFQMAHPIDFIKTFNIDIQNKRLLSNDEIITKAKQADVLKLIKEKLIKQLPEGTAVDELDASALEYMVLTHEGLDILFERGQVTASYLGLQRVSLSREELGEAFILSNKQVVSEIAVSSEVVSVQPPEVKEPPKREIDPSKPMIALTFDDGPSKITRRLLELLDKNGGRATFFVIGNRVETYKETAKSIVEQGSELMGHSWDHKQLTKLTPEEMREELKSTNDAIYAATGVTPKGYRPPYGAVNDELKGLSKEMNLAIINWSLDTEDWKSRKADKIYEVIMSNVKSGGIILCHDLYDATGDAMAKIIPELRKKGYQLVTISEMMEANGKALEAGEVYYGKY